MGFEKIVDSLPNEADVAICDHFLRVFANGPDENSVMFEIFETKNIFYACFAVDEEENIVDTTDCSSVSVSNIVVEDVTNSIWAWDRIGVFLAFRRSGSFAAR